MPVVGHFDHRNLITTPTILNAIPVDFHTVTIPELQDMTMPFKWTAGYTGLMHGIAGWFDLVFAPPSQSPSGVAGTTIEMSTGPAAERTHWQQVRFLFKEPLAVNATETIQGWMRAIVNDMRSYTIYVEVVVGDRVSLSDPAKLDTETFARGTSQQDEHPSRRRGRWELHEQTYNYSYTPGLVPDHKPEYSCLYQPESQIEQSLIIPNFIDQQQQQQQAQPMDFATLDNVMDNYENFIN